jgi:hypothetical protein
MKISAIIDYSATPDEVFAMLIDEDFQNRKCVATGATSHTVDITASQDRTIIVCHRSMPADEFPSFVKSMIGESLSVTETQDWGPPGHDGDREGKLTVAMGGAPIQLDGSISLAQGGHGSLETIEADLKARIPMIGNKIEQAAAPAIQSAIRVESETGEAWLATRN